MSAASILLLDQVLRMNRQAYDRSRQDTQRGTVPISHGTTAQPNTYQRGFTDWRAVREILEDFP